MNDTPSPAGLVTTPGIGTIACAMIRAAMRIVIPASLGIIAATAHAGCRPGAFDAMSERGTIYRPVASSPAPMPLLVLLHGSGGTGAAMLRDSDLARAADRYGFIVTAPDGGIAAGQGYVWNIPAVVTVAGTLPPPDARDDVAYISDLVDRLVATGCVDRRRVYVTGLSGGGRMASWLGCVAADRFAAIAPVVGLRAGRPRRSDPNDIDPATCRARIPLPVIAFAGDADTTNPITGGGAPYWQYPQDAALRRWATLNGCTAPYARNVDAKTYEQGYRRCRDGADVAVRVRRGGPHGWAVADNDAMWAFLSRHTR